MVALLQTLRVLFVVPELAPWVKSGGLGDVAQALPVALRQNGIDARILVPAYPAIANAFPDRQTVCQFAEPGGVLPPAKLQEAEAADGVPLLLVDCPAYFQRPGSAYQDEQGSDWGDNALRFALLSRIAALLAREDSPYGWKPQVVHGNDWPCGLIPAYLHYDARAHAPVVVTIHNIAFQGNFSPHLLGALGLPPEAYAPEGVEFYGRISFLKAGLYFADRITTVSPRYADEIQTPQFGCGMDGLLRARREQVAGILNGIDTESWNPAADPLIAAPYNSATLHLKAENKRALQAHMGLPRDEGLPLLGSVSRLTHQKGLDLLPVLAEELADLPIQLALLGKGEADIEAQLQEMAARHPDRFAVRLGYDETLAHLIEAGADMFCMPSRFEPCGLNQMYSLRYGTPPIVRATGGLADTVVDCTPLNLAIRKANGFTFDEDSPAALLAAIRRAVATWRQADLWRELQQNGMHTDFSWSTAAFRYAEIYRALSD